MRQTRSDYKAWVVLAVLLGAMALTYRWTSTTDTGFHREELEPLVPKRSKRDYKTATLTPGRVVVLKTTRGPIEFVLFEKDCPRATALIAGLIQKRRFDGVKFERVEPNLLIQTASVGKDIQPVTLELRNRLLHEKGSVGLARWLKVGEPAASIFIAIEPMHHLDYEFVTFGRVIKGMDVVEKIRVGDVVTKAAVRPLTEVDRRLFRRALAAEVERRTQ